MTIMWIGGAQPPSGIDRSAPALIVHSPLALSRVPLYTIRVISRAFRCRHSKSTDDAGGISNQVGCSSRPIGEDEGLHEHSSVICPTERLK